MNPTADEIGEKLSLKQALQNASKADVSMVLFVQESGKGKVRDIPDLFGLYVYSCQGGGAGS